MATDSPRGDTHMKTEAQAGVIWAKDKNMGNWQELKETPVSFCQSPQRE